MFENVSSKTATETALKKGVIWLYCFQIRQR
jgi:hypothetical protein